MSHWHEDDRRPRYSSSLAVPAQVSVSARPMPQRALLVTCRVQQSTMEQRMTLRQIAGIPARGLCYHNAPQRFSSAAMERRTSTIERSLRRATCDLVFEGSVIDPGLQPPAPCMRGIVVAQGVEWSDRPALTERRLQNGCARWLWLTRWGKKPRPIAGAQRSDQLPTRNASTRRCDYMEREVFVNREAELRQIDGVLQALQEQQPFEETPLIELCGVIGIGKTALLRQIRLRGLARGLPVLWVGLGSGAGPETLLSQLLVQLPRQEPSEVQAAEPQEETASVERATAERMLPQVLDGLHSLLAQRGAALLLLDAVEAGDKRLTGLLATLLREVGPGASLLLVLTARRPLPFEEERVITGGVSLIDLHGLDRAGCGAYLDASGLALSAEERALLWQWTEGYPLALEVLTEAIRAGLHPHQPTEQRQLFQLLIRRIIRERVLDSLPSAERADAEALLRLLAVPRRFTALLFQELTERFAPTLVQTTPLAYFFLLRALSARTNVLRWYPERAGYALETPVRRLLLLAWHVEEPARLVELHRWLATFNRRLAERVTGSDRLRSLHEWLYHSALSLEATELAQMAQDLLTTLHREPAEVRAQFVEDARQDQDLQAVLGEQAPGLLTGLQALERDD